MNAEAALARSTPLPSAAVVLPSAPLAPHLDRRPLGLRLALLAGLVAVAAAAAAVAGFATPVGVEPALAQLLRGMAVVKAGVALVAVGASLWRFGQPISAGAATGYLVGSWSLGAATVLIACLRFVPAAAVLFHAGLLGMLALAWREGRFDRRRPGP